MGDASAERKTAVVSLSCTLRDAALVAAPRDIRIPVAAMSVAK